MKSKIIVHGRARGWTAMGIIQAYVKINPHVTIEELNKAFPRELFGSTTSKKELFIEKQAYIEKLKAAGKEVSPYLTCVGEEAQEYSITLEDGKEYTFYDFMWGDDSYPKIAELAKQYGIEVDFEDIGRGHGKGGYTLEYLEAAQPIVIEEGTAKKEPKDQEPKVVKKVVNNVVNKVVGRPYIPWWMWLLLILAIIIIILLLMYRPKPEVKIETRVDTVYVTKTIVETKVDTVYMKELEVIDKNFNAAKFKVGKADLSEEAKFVLHDLAKLMSKNDDLRLRIAGHTSAEGSEEVNQQLSEKRAQAAVKFLIEHEGVDADRLEAKGYGSSKLKNPDDPKDPENRRTEFEIIQ